MPSRTGFTNHLTLVDDFIQMPSVTIFSACAVPTLVQFRCLWISEHRKFGFAVARAVVLVLEYRCIAFEFRKTLELEDLWA